MNHFRNIPIRFKILAVFIILNSLAMTAGVFISSSWYWTLLLSAPLLILCISDMLQKKHAIIRNYPVAGRLRYLFESIRPELRQYFFESDLDGAPFNRRQRSIVYQRAKNEKQTVAFGMQADPTSPGYEWVTHSIYPVHLTEKDLRVKIGNHQCLQPYSSSIFNIGAMSYGALSKTAIMALNGGAKLGNFAQNTGEGGISRYHLEGGDLIWQIGTGYFGCRNSSGRFDPMAFRKNALRPEVKMIELKLSQGAKPGHGGILPANKNTIEISQIRLVEPGTTVYSPTRHAEFGDAKGMIQFLQLMRELSGGKPVGFKMCIGQEQEFIDICNAIEITGLIPDFVCIDGAEGGTGAAPLEFTDHIGMPLYDALAFVKKTLDEYDLSKSIRIIAAGKIITGFDILKVMSLGASTCYCARGMMFALGCIQALICDTGRCPVGVATQDKSLYQGLDPADKKVRVASFHSKTIEATREMMEACGFADIPDVHPSRFLRRINHHDSKSYQEIYFPNKRRSLMESLITLKSNENAKGKNKKTGHSRR